MVAWITGSTLALELVTSWPCLKSRHASPPSNSKLDSSRYVESGLWDGHFRDAASREGLVLRSEAMASLWQNSPEALKALKALTSLSHCPSVSAGV